MKSSDHAFKITYKIGPNGTEIDMDKHEEGQEKPNDNMYEIIEFQSAASKKLC